MRRLGSIGITAIASVTIASVTAVRPPALLLWNATASLPVGLYVVHPARGLHRADLVLAMPSAPIAEFLADGGYLPRGVPLLKQILALPGQMICRIGATITVDGIAAGEALERDGHGRDLPAWSGCRLIAPDQVFLMNTNVSESFDGRYFGLTPASAVIARASALWTDETGDGRFTWQGLNR